jgi:hypothetical protein
MHPDFLARGAQGDKADVRFGFAQTEEDLFVGPWVPLERQRGAVRACYAEARASLLQHVGSLLANTLQGAQQENRESFSGGESGQLKKEVGSAEFLHEGPPQELRRPDNRHSISQDHESVEVGVTKVGVTLKHADMVDVGRDNKPRFALSDAFCHTSTHLVEGEAAERNAEQFNLIPFQ